MHAEILREALKEIKIEQVSSKPLPKEKKKPTNKKKLIKDTI